MDVWRRGRKEWVLVREGVTYLKGKELEGKKRGVRRKTWFEKEESECRCRRGL